MSSIRVLKRKGTLCFDFRFRGIRCRAQTVLPDTTANRKKMKTVLERIEADIAMGVFDYRRFFAESASAAQLDPPAGPTPAIDVATEATTHSSDFANEWYAQHEIEWKRSYRKTVRGALDQHLIPRFGEVDVGRITREEILNFRSTLGKLPGRQGKSTLSAQRINHVMGVLRRVLEDAADRFHFGAPTSGASRSSSPRVTSSPSPARKCSRSCSQSARTSTPISGSASPPACAPARSMGSSGATSTSTVA